jgi:S1-C subfamily serine protease
MRALRPILLAIFCVAAFYYFTTHFHGTSSLGAERSSQIDIIQASGPQSFDAEEQENIAVYKKALPSVVNITSTAVAFDFFYGPVPQKGQGSGFVLDKEGRILTNYHVVANARQLEVNTSDKKKYSAKVVGTDPQNDLAVIQVTGGALTPAVLGDSKGLVVGQKVFAIGNPFGLSGTMTRGIISSIRSVRGEGGFIDEAIQTDAAINPGNSGGPLLNSRGEVIGINSMIFTGGAEQSAGIGFAIPINTAKAVLNDLVTLGSVRRPTLGIVPLPIGPELAQQMGLAADSGLLIVQVTPGSAADKAGLHAGTERAYIGNVPITLGGDLIVSVDGQPVQDQQDLAHVMQNHHSGDSVTLAVYRGKKRMEVKVVLGEAKNPR